VKRNGPFHQTSWSKSPVGSEEADKSFDIFVFVSYAQRFFPVSLWPVEGADAHRSHKRTDSTACGTKLSEEDLVGAVEWLELEKK
jgi:hypothetical protein